MSPGVSTSPAWARLSRLVQLRSRSTTLRGVFAGHDLGIAAEASRCIRKARNAALKCWPHSAVGGGAALAQTWVPSVSENSSGGSTSFRLRP